jgi:hypothetical protein
MFNVFAFPLIIFAMAVEPSSGIFVIECPARIQTNQSIAVAVPGWEALEFTTRGAEFEIEKVSHRYFGVSFYYAHPSEHMELRADDNDKPLTWSFGDSSQIWASCGYSGTTVRLVTQLPPGLTKCWWENVERDRERINIGKCRKAPN